MAEFRVRSLAAGLLAAAMALAPVSAALAQDAAAVRAGKRVFSTVAVCADCHGWSGDGVGNPRAPRGPSIRATALTRDQILEVVRCGRPGTAMPHHDRNAYTDDRCYGATAADLGDQVPPAGKFLSEKQLNDLIEYLMARVVGHGDPTKADCEDYFGANAGACRAFN